MAKGFSDHPIWGNPFLVLPGEFGRWRLGNPTGYWVKLMVNIAISVGEVCIWQGDLAGTSAGEKFSGKDRGDARPRLSA
jgi:hypothetical protein